jgi:hypothetical protein
VQPPTNWAQVLSPLVSALASLLPGIALAGFAVYFIKSNLAAGLALKTADVLVTAALAGLGWAIARFLSSVDKRFDASDASLREVKSATDKRFDTTDASLREVKSVTDGILREVKSLLEQQRLGR